MTEFCLASTYNNKIDATGWYYSDKLDGIRCQWSGREMFTRNGTQLNPPAYFKNELPGSPLDGELYIPAYILSSLASGQSINGLWFDPKREMIVDDPWIAPGRVFLNLVKRATNRRHYTESTIFRLIVSSSSRLAWSLVTYYVFDAPAISLPFRHRLQSLQTYFSQHPSTFIRLLHHAQVTDCQMLGRLLEESPCEGLMLRNPTALYDRKRSWSMVKLKKWLDADCRVIEAYSKPTIPGRRPHLIVKAAGSDHPFILVNGVTQTAIDQTSNHASSLITIKFNGFDARGLPRQPVFQRLRLDV